LKKASFHCKILYGVPTLQVEIKILLQYLPISERFVASSQGILTKLLQDIRQIISRPYALKAIGAPPHHVYKGLGQPNGLASHDRET